VEPGVDPKVSLRFGLYQVDLLQGVLSRQGVRVKLQEQPFRILALLLQKPGEIVTREDLRQELWPEGTHVNFDGSLNAALKKLRAALQDNAENPRFIETVPRQGYRFLAPVQFVQSSPAVAVLSPNDSSVTSDETLEVRMHLQPEFSPERAAELSKERRKAELAAKWTDITLLSCAIVFGSWLLFFIVYPVPRPSVERMTRITNAGGIDEWGGIVSDGTRIFFLERDGGHWNLMQTSVEGGNAEKLAAPFENTRIFAISPDHSQFLIGQFTRRDDEMPLWLWPVQGGQPRRMGEAVGHDPAWSPDGSQIVFVRGRSLYSVHPDGTQLHELAHGPGLPHFPAWSPDGEMIRFSMDCRWQVLSLLRMRNVRLQSLGHSRSLELVSTLASRSRAVDAWSRFPARRHSSASGFARLCVQLPLSSRAAKDRTAIASRRIVDSECQRRRSRGLSRWAPGALHRSPRRLALAQ
jgi:DNA-binding winged helix-turn-helix (wHTH) protein